MTLDNVPTKHTSTTLAKAADDEPIFVLRASDSLAVETVRHWAAHALVKGVPATKVQDALDVASAMAEWPNKKLPD
jgi:hypothetical protein